MLPGTEVDYSVQKSLPPIPIPCQMNRVHTLPPKLFNVILPSMPRIPLWSFLLSFSSKNLVSICLHSHACYMHSPPYPWFDHSKKVRWETQIYKVLLRSFLQPPATSFLTDLNILFRALFPYTLNLCSSLCVRSGKVSILYILWKNLEENINE